MDRTPASLPVPRACGPLGAAMLRLLPVAAILGTGACSQAVRLDPGAANEAVVPQVERAQTPADDGSTEVAQIDPGARPASGPTIVPGPRSVPRTAPDAPPKTAAPAETATTLDESWEVVHVDGKRIGYGRTNARRFPRGERSVIRTTSETRATFRRLGQSIAVNVTLQVDETDDGTLLGFAIEHGNGQASPSRTVGRIEGRTLETETTTAGRTERRTVAWDAPHKSAFLLDRMFRAEPPAAGRTWRLDVYLPETAQTSTLRATADDWQIVTLHDGSSRRLLKVRIGHSAQPALATRKFLDEQGIVHRTESEFAGLPLVAFRVPAEVALESIAGPDLDLAARTLIKVDPPLPRVGRIRQAAWRIELADGDPAGHFPPSETQSVRRVSEHVVEAVVVRPTFPERARNVPSPGAEFLEPSAFLQVKDEQVAAHARAASAGETDPVRIALRMEKYVHEKMSRKDLSTALASAAETARTLTGDCTEHAVLLAAMLRAARIPSRLAVGLVHVEGFGSCGVHMWTEAWLDGRWLPLDAMTGTGGTSAGHLKMGDASLADDGPAPHAAFLRTMEPLGRLKLGVVRAE